MATISASSSASLVARTTVVNKRVAVSSSPVLGAVLILCLVKVVSSSSSFNDENHIKMVSDGVRIDVADNLDDHLSGADLNSALIQAIYTFGDSLSDTGNYVIRGPGTTFTSSPYGDTFFHKPSRASDGRLMIDFFAEYLGLPYVDAYHNKSGNFAHGANFAVIGATALDASVLEKKSITPYVTKDSLSVQLGWFKSHLNSLCKDNSEYKKKLAKTTIFMGEIGGNDYNFAILQGKPMAEVYKLVPEVIQAISNAVKEVIGLGATGIVVPGNLPIGCMTCYLTAFKSKDPKMYDDLKCLKNLNRFAKIHNQLLREAITKLQKEHPQATIVYLDFYAAFINILQNPPKLGFDEKLLYKACCGTGNNEYNFDFGKSCGSKGVTACKNPEKHVNWDGFHLTEEAYKAMTVWLMINTPYTPRESEIA